MDDAQRYRSICSFWRTFISPTDQECVRWTRFEDGFYVYLETQFLVKHTRDLGVMDGPMLAYGLYLALQKKSSSFIEIIDSAQNAEDGTNANESISIQPDSRDIILRPAMTNIPSPLPFTSLCKKTLIGNCLLQGMETYFKELIQSV